MGIIAKESYKIENKIWATKTQTMSAIKLLDCQLQDTNLQPTKQQNYHSRPVELNTTIFSPRSSMFIKLWKKSYQPNYTKP